jgi:hypothetical protein
MTEAEWLACTDPQKMLNHLELPFKNGIRPAWVPPIVSERKVCLFLAACHERSEDKLPRHMKTDNRFEGRAAEATGPISDPTGSAVGMTTALYGSGLALGAGVLGSLNPECQCTLLRCIFGNPFRPVTLNPTVLTWNGGTVPRMAQAIYDDRRFSDLPILADALEEAGCDNPDILAHCRSEGPHVRGCWVVDMILGKS